MTDAGNRGVVLPDALAWLRADPAGRAWLDGLPALVAAVAADWGLRVEAPYADGFASLALRVRTAGAVPAVLKLQFPDRESRAEADALAAWNGNGAVRLLESDPRRRALLLERCEPGTSLLEATPAVRLDVLEGLLPRLWVGAPAGVGTLADEAARWAGDLEASWQRSGAGLPRAIVDEALTALLELPGEQDEAVLLNQDLHAGNVLAAAREPWLVIDPKPLIGERAFGLAPVLRDVGRHAHSAVVPALDRLSAGLGLDRERCRRWALAQTVAWGFDGKAVDPVHAAVALVLHAAR
ncbi:aminoglycoside phosphotransferase family protein [Amnibacterium sp.]|uniref:aminoglycoside phosphotransferase family protein n=1 Tax=Amnibacterium sp. TaxID=1872496 RepID=UPI00260987D6|nr:aminoglycoside phosphotransferase family protein [Amnibacterium sp.]MCU1472954.1 streptomycin 6-kinase N-terminal [Amnibacterium sp.]